MVKVSLSSIGNGTLDVGNVLFCEHLTSNTYSARVYFLQMPLIF